MQASGNATHAGHPLVQAMSQNKTPEWQPMPAFELPLYTEDGQILTTEKYLERLASGKLANDPLADFILLRIIPDARQAPDDVHLIALQLQASVQLPMLEFLLERCGPLTSLPLHIERMSIEDSVRFGQILRRTQPDIRQLDGEFVELYGRDDACKFRNIVDGCSKLNRLDLRSVESGAVPEFASVIASLPQLEWLQINSIEHDNDEDFLSLIDALRRAPAIKVLRFPSLENEVTTLAAVLELLGSLNAEKRLTGLALGIGDFEPPKLLPKLCELIRKLAAIEILELGAYCEWREDGDAQEFTSALAHQLQQNSSLKHLSLDCSNLLSEIPALCEALRHSAAPMEQIHIELPSHFWTIPRAALDALAETARQRPGLLTIRVKELADDFVWKRKFESSNTLDGVYTRYQTSGEPITHEGLWACFCEANAPLMALLDRNRALHQDEIAKRHVKVFAPDVAPPDSSACLEHDSSHLVIQHLLAHSASVKQFEQVIAHIEYTLAAKNFVTAEPAPTSTASPLPNTTTASGTNG